MRDRAVAQQALWDRLPCAEDVSCGGRTTRDVVAALIRDGTLTRKQAWRMLDRWTDEGRYEYGVSLDLGWKRA